MQTFGSTRDMTIRLQDHGEAPKCCVRSSRRSSPASTRRRKISDLAVVGPQVGDELRNSAIKSLAVTLVLIARLHHPAFPHLATVARRHPRRDA